jgi:hypothetical protein
MENLEGKGIPQIMQNKKHTTHNCDTNLNLDLPVLPNSSNTNTNLKEA